MQNNLTSPEVAAKFAPPILWLSHNDYDNSGGGQICDQRPVGSLQGEPLHESAGKSSPYLVTPELPDGRQQAAATKFPLVHQLGDAWTLGSVDHQLRHRRPERVAEQCREADRIRPRPLSHRKARIPVRGVKVVPGGGVAVHPAAGQVRPPRICRTGAASGGITSAVRTTVPRRSACVGSQQEGT